MLVAVVCFGTVVFDAPSSVIDAATTIEQDKAAIKQKEDELERITAQRKEAQKKLNELKNSQSSFMVKKTALDMQISTLSNEVEMLESLISDYKTQIDKTEAQIGELELSIEDTFEQLKTNIRITYEQGVVSYIELIASAESFADFLSRMDIIGAIMEQNSRSLEEMDRQQNELRAARDSLLELKSSSEERVADMTEQKKELDATLKELDDYIYSIQSDVNKAQAALKEAEAAEKALDAELEKMLRELQQRENSQYVGGTFNWPTPVSYKRISSKFGWRKLNGEDNYHGGIDIPCPTGTNITASNGGTVIKSEWHYSYGYYVLINHGGGMSTLYAHNSKLLVSVGDVVTQGQVIALAGNTGNSYGSHCHFEVRVDGTRKNPMDYVTPPQGWYYS